MPRRRSPHQRADDDPEAGSEPAVETVQAAPCYQYDVEDCIPSDDIDISPLLQTVNELAGQAVTTASRCVNGSEPICAQAEEIALDAVALAQAAAQQCLNDSNFTCQTTVATVVALANTAVDLALGCVSQDVPACRTAFDIANQGVDTALEQADACLNDYSSACQSARRTAEQTADMLIQLVTAAADACLTDSSSVCQTTINLVYATALQQAAAVQAAARDCLQNDNSLCQTAVQLAVDTGLGAVATATDLATWCLEDGGSICQTTLSTAMQLVLDTQKLAQDTQRDCLYEDSSLCQMAITAAQGLAASAQATVWACVNETDPTCETAMDAARNVVAEAGACAQELGYENIGTASTTSLGPVASADASSDLSDNCREVNSLAMGAAQLALDTATECMALTSGACAVVVTAVQALIDSLYATAQACLNETDPTCKTAMDAARNVVAEAGACAQELGYENIGTASTTFVGPVATADASSDLSDNCREVNSLAMGVAQLALDTATECVALTSGTCAVVVTAAQALIDSLYATAQACVNETDPTCKTAMDAARNVVAEAGACAQELGYENIGTASTTFVGPVASADASSDLSDNCREVNSLAMGVAQLALDTATECVALTSGTCAVVVTTAQALIDSLYAHRPSLRERDRSDVQDGDRCSVERAVTAKWSPDVPIVRRTYFRNVLIGLVSASLLSIPVGAEQLSTRSVAEESNTSDSRIESLDLQALQSISEAADAWVQSRVDATCSPDSCSKPTFILAGRVASDEFIANASTLQYRRLYGKGRSAAEYRLLMADGSSELLRTSMAAAAMTGLLHLDAEHLGATVSEEQLQDVLSGAAEVSQGFGKVDRAVT